MALQDRVRDVAAKIIQGEDFIEDAEAFNDHPAFEGLVQACLNPIRLIDHNLAALMLYLNGTHSHTEIELCIRYLNELIRTIIDRLPKPMTVLTKSQSSTPLTVEL